MRKEEEEEEDAVNRDNPFLRLLRAGAREKKVPPALSPTFWGRSVKGMKRERGTKMEEEAEVGRF